MVRARAPLVEVTGGEPLLQPGVYPLMEALLAAGLTVLLETSGAIDVRLVPPAVHKIVDLKTPSSGESDRNDLRNSRLDERERRAEVRHRLPRGLRVGARLIASTLLDASPYGLLFSTVFGKLHPRELAEWIIEDRLAGALPAAAAQVRVGPRRAREMTAFADDAGACASVSRV